MNAQVKIEPIPVITVNAQKAEELTGIGARTWKNMARAGVIPSYGPGKYYLFRPEDLQKHILNHPKESTNDNT